MRFATQGTSFARFRARGSGGASPPRAVRAHHAGRGGSSASSPCPSASSSSPSACGPRAAGSPAAPSCRSRGDPLPARAVDQVRHAALLRGHREHDRLDPLRARRSSTLTSLSWLPRPGISFRTPWSGPIRRSIFWAARKSSNVNWPRRMRPPSPPARPPRPPPRPSRSATGRRPCRGSATPSGRGGSTRAGRASRRPRSSLIGLPVTALTESAAPPRASPSSLVRTTPSNATRSWKASATATASWPVMASRTSSTLCGFALLADVGELLHELLVDVEAAGGVDDHDVAALGRARARGPSRPPRDRVGA